MCGTQLSQEQDGAKFPIAFLSNTFTEIQRNGESQNRKPTKYTIPLPNGIATLKEPTS